MPLIQAYYDPRALTVTTITYFGLTEVRQVLPLETYTNRLAQWPGYYPETVQVVKRGEALRV